MISHITRQQGEDVRGGDIIDEVAEAVWQRNTVSIGHKSNRVNRYDHRLIDGRKAVQFLVRVKELIEDPERLLLEG